MTVESTAPTARRLGAMVCLVLVMFAVFAFDYVYADANVLPFLCVPVLIAVIFASPWEVLGLAALSVVLAVISDVFTGHDTGNIANTALLIGALAVIGAVAVGLSLANQKRAALNAGVDEQLTQSEAMYRLLAENASDVVYLVDPSGKIAWVSPAITDALGWLPEQVIGLDGTDLVNPDDLPDVHVSRELIRAGQDSPVRRVRYRTALGDYRRMSVRVRPIRATDEHLDGVVIALRDITDEYAARTELAYRAFHDPLTRLRNRAWILDMLDSDLRAADRHGGRVGLLFIDLDDFAAINSARGHVVGDEILAEIAANIGTALSPGDRLGRFGGDEFLVITPDVREARDLELTASRICAAIRAGRTAENDEIVTTASVGITASRRGVTSASLLLEAETAQLRARQSGSPSWRFFDEQDGEHGGDRIATEDEVRHALLAREFVAYYQPIVKLADLTVVGYEALVRWNHPTRGTLAPAEFLPVAEDSGLISELGDQVLDQVCEVIASRPDITGSFSFNTSPMQIGRPDWHDRLVERVRAHGVDPHRLVVEVTETAVLSILDSTRSDLADLRSLGLGIHVDDFGTGYSSIALLRDLPITGLKLDASFTRQLESSHTSRTLAAGLAGLAEGLDLVSIAEGIETVEEARTLAEMGWLLGQGYLFGRPQATPALTVAITELV